MEKGRKNLYESPTSELVEITAAGFICASEVQSDNSIIAWINGDTLIDQLIM